MENSMVPQPGGVDMPCKLPFSFCSVRHGAINGYLNKRLCPLLPAVTKTMLTGSQRSIHQQLGFNSGRPPSSIFLATVSVSVHFKNHIWSTYTESAAGKVSVWQVFPAKENRLRGFHLYLLRADLNIIVNLCSIYTRKWFCAEIYSGYSV